MALPPRVQATLRTIEELILPTLPDAEASELRQELASYRDALESQLAQGATVCGDLLTKLPQLTEAGSVPPEPFDEWFGQYEWSGFGVLARDIHAADPEPRSEPGQLDDWVFGYSAYLAAEEPEPIPSDLPAERAKAESPETDPPTPSPPQPLTRASLSWSSWLRTSQARRPGPSAPPDPAQSEDEAWGDAMG